MTAILKREVHRTAENYVPESQLCMDDFGAGVNEYYSSFTD